MLDGCYEIVERGEAPVVSAASPGQFPDPLGRVELRAVRRQKVQSELVATFVAPRLVQFGMVVLCIVCDHNSAPIRGATYNGICMRIGKLDMFTCQQALTRLYDYLDHHINDRDAELVAEHLAICEACTRRFGFERKLLDRVREKSTSADVPDDVKQRLRKMLLKLREGELGQSI